MTSTVQTAAARQPFAPVDRSRLHRLTSTKNRQNALPPNTPTVLKRKAAVFEADDDSTPTTIKRKASIFEADDDNSENIDPALFASPKRVRGKDGLTLADYSKPTKSHFVLTKALSSQNEVATSDPVKSIISRPVITRPVLHPRSPASKVRPRSPASKSNTSTINTTISSLSAPAGRSPTKKQRVGILNRRRTASPLTRIDPPNFGIGGSVASAPFSIDAALGGTIPSYRRRTRGAVRIPTSLREPQVKASWFFEIHEDTAEETMTNLMEHSTCVLDISSDEESGARREDRGKENVPPTDDASQTPSGSSMASRSTSVRTEVDPDVIEVDRNPLGNLAPKDFYPEGLSENDVVYVDDEDDEDDEDYEEEPTSSELTDASDMGKNYDFEFTAPDATMGGSMEVEGGSSKGKATLDELMQRSSSTTGHAALFQPLEEAGENFEVWESASAKGEAEVDE